MNKPLFFSYWALLGWIILATFIEKPPEANLESTLIIIAIKLFPLALFFRSILQENGYGLLALTLVLMFYMGFATMDCFAGGLKAVMGGIGIALQCVLAGFSLQGVKRQPRGQGSL